MDKKIPNPNGKKGNKDHQDLIDKLYEKLKDLFGNPRKEFKIKLPNGKKRYIDVAAIDEEGNPIELHQVGRTNKDGSPVIRERRASEDIEKATGINVIFHAIIIFLALFSISYVIYRITNSPKNKNIQQTELTKN